MLVSVFVAGVNAHGAMIDPPGRNMLAYPKFRNGKEKYSDVRYDECIVPKGLGEEYDSKGLGRKDSLTAAVRKRGRQDNNDMDPAEIGPVCGNGELDTMKKYGEFKTNQFGVTKAYKPGSTITLSFHMTAQHGGHTWADYACLDNHLNQFTSDKSVKWTRLKVAGGGTTVTWKKVADKETYDKYDVVLPNEKCNHGVLQWTFFGEQDWAGQNVDGEVESFFNCADIRITDDVAGFKATCPDGKPATEGGGSTASDGNTNTGGGGNGNTGSGGNGNTGGSSGSGNTGGGGSDGGGGSAGNSNQGGENIPTTTNSGDDSATTMLLILGGIFVLLVIAVAVVVIWRKKAKRDADAQKASQSMNNFNKTRPGYKPPRSRRR